MTAATLDPSKSTTTRSDTMQAIVQDVYGSDARGRAAARDRRRPAIGDDEILVRVHAASVDRGTWHIMAGLPYPIRAAGFGLRRSEGAQPGAQRRRDGRGRRRARDRLRAGRRGLRDVRRRVRRVRRGRRETARPQAGEPLLRAGGGGPRIGAHGAASRARPGAGAARTAGPRSSARRAGSARSRSRSPRPSAARSRACAARPRRSSSATSAPTTSSTTRREDFAGGEQRYDAIIDIGGNSRLSRLRRALTPRGTLVIAGGETDGRWLGGSDRQIRAQLLSPFVEPEARDVHRLRERCGPPSAHEARRGRQAHPGHRPDLPAWRRRRGRPLRAGRSRARQGRHRRVSTASRYGLVAPSRSRRRGALRCGLAQPLPLARRLELAARAPIHIGCRRSQRSQNSSGVERACASWCSAISTSPYGESSASRACGSPQSTIADSPLRRTDAGERLTHQQRPRRTSGRAAAMW